MLLLESKVLAISAQAVSASKVISRPAIQRQVNSWLTGVHEFDVSQCKHINVAQGEYAVLDSAKESADKLLLTSLEATTCCVVALACRESGRYAIAHLDESVVQTPFCLEPLLKGMVQPNFYMVGGYCEPSGIGRDVATAVLKSAQAVELPIHLKLVLVDALNTMSDGSPRVCSLGLYLDSSQERAVQMQCCNKGPDIVKRMARSWAERCNNLVNVYDASQQAMLVRGFPVKLSLQQANNFSLLLTLPDHQFLRYTSTSPEHEAETYVPGDRRNCSATVTLSCQQCSHKASAVSICDACCCRTSCSHDMAFGAEQR